MTAASVVLSVIGQNTTFTQLIPGTIHSPCGKVDVGYLKSQ
jgi:hypothetical protein